MLVVEHPLHLLIREACRQVDGPVAEAQKERLSLLVAAIYPCVTQTGVHLMQVIERCPRTEIDPEVATLKIAPDALAVRHAAHVAFAPVGVAFHVGIGTELQLADHVFHASAALFITRGGVDGHRRQIVAAHMAVQSVPVGVGLGPWLQAGFLAVRGQQTVNVVL